MLPELFSLEARVLAAAHVRVADAKKLSAVASFSDIARALKLFAFVGWGPLTQPALAFEAPVSLALGNKPRITYAETQSPKPKLKAKLPSSTICCTPVSEARESLRPVPTQKLETTAAKNRVDIS